MKTKILSAIITAGIIFFWSCKKKETPSPDPTTPLEFTSLTLNPDTITPGTFTAVSAAAKGDNLSYQWSTTHGDLFGSGASITYGSAPCCVGTNVITCKVSDSKNSITKNVNIVVKLP
jgi:hypothetical protein